MNLLQFFGVVELNYDELVSDDGACNLKQH
jgi:hypothetical protein